MTVASTIKLRLLLRIALARIVNYDCSLCSKLKRNFQSQICDHKPFIVQATGQRIADLKREPQKLGDK
jgi:hypothetical protein